MTKTTGLGDNFYLDGYDLSGDIGSIQGLNNKRALLDITGLPDDAVERLPGLGDADMAFTSWYNRATSYPAGAHTVLKNVTVGDHHALYFRGTLLGGIVAAMIGAQASYNLVRNNQGGLSATTMINESGGTLIDWGISLTPGKYTSVAPENLTPTLDVGKPNGSAGSLSAYLQIFQIVGPAGNDITVKLQHSDYNATAAEVNNAILLVTNLLNSHSYAPTGAGYSSAEARRVEITIVDTTPSIVSGTVTINGTDTNDSALAETVSIAAGAGLYKTVNFFKTVTSVVTAGVAVLGGAGDETIKVGVEAAAISYSDITAGSFQNVDVAAFPYKEHILATGPIKRWVRAVTLTVDGYTSAIFAVAIKRN